MGMVLSFSPRLGAGNRQKPSGELASVIIFPGVRYERLGEALAENAGAQQIGPAAKTPSSH